MKGSGFKKIILLLMMTTMLFVVSACVPGDGSSTLANPAGLFLGIWHGWIAPFSLILSLFNKSTSIYESFNTGFSYDFGFYAAIISGFGGLSFSRRKKRNRK